MLSDCCFVSFETVSIEADLCKSHWDSARNIKICKLGSEGKQEEQSTGSHLVSWYSVGRCRVMHSNCKLDLTVAELGSDAK